MPATRAAAWLETHLDRLIHLSRYHFRHRPRDVREEATAEILALTYQSAPGAARRGTLSCLTPGTCVACAARHFPQRPALRGLLKLP